jgi:NADPH2 dehydrogenase
MRHLGTIKRVQDLLSYAEAIGIQLPFDPQASPGPDPILGRPYSLDGATIIGNRLAILPVEGWDSTPDGLPSEATFRRWQRWGASGAKLIMGGEAVAVSADGRGSPSELLIDARTMPGIRELRGGLVLEHAKRFGTTEDLLVGLQLNHAGRLSRPHDIHRPEPRALYRHPLLDVTCGVTGDADLLTDGEIEALIGTFVEASRLAQQAGFDFVDIKHCHGYLGHEFLSAVDRPGPYGGSFENRTRFLREIVSGVRSEAPGMRLAVRLSAVDFVPFVETPDDTSEPAQFGEDGYPYAFGGDGTGLGIDLAEPSAFLHLCSRLGIELVCISAGADHCFHVMGPSFSNPLPPRRPPEDPLVSVARLISVTAQLKRLHPQLAFVGSGYSYLGRWLPPVARAVVGEGLADFVGLGRLAIACPEAVGDMLAGRRLNPERLCRTCGYCAVAPLYGWGSGCYLRDAFYHDRLDYGRLRRLTGAAEPRR